MNNNNLWAPWRRAYLQDLARKAEHAGWDDVSAGSFLVDYWNHPEQDEANHVVVRDAFGMIILNKYPYANGHLLIALGDARPRVLDYSEAQRAAFWKLVEQAMDLVERAFAPQGVNMGINEGRAAGAGVPEHLHAHVVPRWSGDTNFITVVGDVRVIPTALDRVAERYREVARA